MDLPRVLVVEDAEEIADLLDGVLTTAGFDVRLASQGPSGLAEALAWRPDVVVLDLNLPGLDGVEVCRRLRSDSDAYVLMLTARGDEIDRVVGLSVGADDYVTKPFSPREIVARIQALLRRPRAVERSAPEPAPQPQAPTRRFGPLDIDVTARDVTVDAVPVTLTRIEFDILDALSENPRRVVTRQQLRDRVWGGDWLADDHAVDVHLSNLRRKLARAGAPRAVTTVRGVGYRMTPA